MKEQPENYALRLIKQVGNIEFAKNLCLQMIAEEKDWLTFFHLSENKNLKAANEKINYWERVRYTIEKCYS